MLEKVFEKVIKEKDSAEVAAFMGQVFDVLADTEAGLDTYEEMAATQAPGLHRELQGVVVPIHARNKSLKADLTKLTR